MNSAPKNEAEIPKADLRQYLRAPLIVQKVHLDTDRTVFFGYSKNISCSGLFIATTNPIAVGEQIELEIPLPYNTNNTVRCSCEVVWKRPLGRHLPFEPGIGLKFIDMPKELAKEIDDWIREQVEIEEE